MSASASNWHPLGEADLTWAHETLAPVLLAWNEQWFPAPVLALASADLIAPGARLPAPKGQACWRAGSGLDLYGGACVARRYAAAAMAIPPSLGPPPAELAEPVAQDLLDSLLNAICAAMLPRAEGPVAQRIEPAVETEYRHGGLRLRLGAAGWPDLLEIRYTATLLWSRPAPPMRSLPHGVVAPRALALGASSVRIVANLGQCRLSALQLSELEVGDVLSLSQRLDDPIELRLADAGADAPLLARGLLGRSDDRLAVALTSLCDSPKP